MHGGPSPGAPKGNRNAFNTVAIRQKQMRDVLIGRRHSGDRGGVLSNRSSAASDISSLAWVPDP